MRVVTPHALKWLIRRRAQVAGSLIAGERAVFRLEAARSELEAKANSVKQLRKDLQALDLVISQHEILIDPSTIPPCTGQRRPSFYAHGGLVRAIYRCLREARGRWRSTTEIMMYVTSYCARPILEGETDEYRRSVRKMLSKLHNKGIILRASESGFHRTDARWAMDVSSVGKN